MEAGTMGVQSKLLGYIEEAWPGQAAGGDPVRIQHLLDTDSHISRHNEDVLRSLPETDEWPPLCRPMFAWASVDALMIVYKNRLIHLAASLKQMDWELRDWLDKFEGLLRRVYWESAYIRFEAAYIGTHEFAWQPTKGWVSELCQGRLSPIVEWSFTSTLPPEELARLRESSK
jgi:hypothetical protein